VRRPDFAEFVPSTGKNMALTGGAPVTEREERGKRRIGPEPKKKLGRHELG